MALMVTMIPPTVLHREAIMTAATVMISTVMMRITPVKVKVCLEATARIMAMVEFLRAISLVEVGVAMPVAAVTLTMVIIAAVAVVATAVVTVAAKVAVRQTN